MFPLLVLKMIWIWFCVGFALVQSLSHGGSPAISIALNEDFIHDELSNVIILAATTLNKVTFRDVSNKWVSVKNAKISDGVKIDSVAVNLEDGKLSVDLSNLALTLSADLNSKPTTIPIKLSMTAILELDQIDGRPNIHLTKNKFEIHKIDGEGVGKKMLQLVVWLRFAYVSSIVKRCSQALTKFIDTFFRGLLNGLTRNIHIKGMPFAIKSQLLSPPVIKNDGVTMSLSSKIENVKDDTDNPAQSLMETDFTPFSDSPLDVDFPVPVSEIQERWPTMTNLKVPCKSMIMGFIPILLIQVLWILSRHS